MLGAKRDASGGPRVRERKTESRRGSRRREVGCAGRQMKGGSHPILVLGRTCWEDTRRVAWEQVAESRVSSEEGGRSEGKRSAKDFGEPAWRTAGRTAGVG
eukprot:767174-Hanusia_phi.AAC.2